MFADLSRYPQVLPPLHYRDEKRLLEKLEPGIVVSAEKRAAELTGYSRVTPPV
jgi:hypothetical protein